MGIAALLAVSLALASCSKDENNDAHTPEVARVDSTETTTPVTGYAVSENEQIMFSSRGIIDVINNQTDSPNWVLSYQEIAERLDIDFSKVSTIQITRDCILNNGLWRFDVRFDGQAEGAAYAIDVDLDTGIIEWAISLDEMPGGSVFTLNLV